MDQKQIERLMLAMERSSITRVAIKQEGFEIELERASLVEVPLTRPSLNEISREEKQPLQQRPQMKHEEPPVGTFVTSPMVGTFYSSPSPEDPPFIKVGDQVDESMVICIIEAMKVMNEVKAGVRGKVVEILVKSGDPVEFGTRIFRIES